MRLPFPFLARPLRLIVSCCNQRGATFLVELRNLTAQVKKISDTGATGLAIDPDRGRLYVAHPDGVRVFNRRLEVSNIGYALAGADVHDIKLCPEGLAVVETGENRLAVYARPGDLAWQWSPGKVGADSCHMNSALISNDEWLISMFSPEGLGEPWRERLDGAVVRIPRSKAFGEGAIVVRGLQQPHSLVTVDGRIWLCESRRKQVLSIDPEGTGLNVEAELPSYARGLVVTSKFIIVGQSRSDTHWVKALEGEDDPRDPGMCGIWFIPRNGDARFFVELPAQEVYDVALLPW